MVYYRGYSCETLQGLNRGTSLLPWDAGAFASHHSSDEPAQCTVGVAAIFSLCSMAVAGVFSWRRCRLCTPLASDGASRYSAGFGPVPGCVLTISPCSTSSPNVRWTVARGSPNWSAGTRLPALLANDPIFLPMPGLQEHVNLGLGVRKVGGQPAELRRMDAPRPIEVRIACSPPANSTTLVPMRKIIHGRAAFGLATHPTRSPAIPYLAYHSSLDQLGECLHDSAR